MKRLIFIFGLVILGVITWLLASDKGQMPVASAPEKKIPSRTDSPLAAVIAQNLEIPWGMVFLPDGSILVTERPGRVRLIDSKGVLQGEPVVKLLNIKAIGEGGLLGITKHPKFSINNYIYLYYTYGETSGNTLNRVVRMTYINKQLKDEQIIVDKIPGSSNHNGGRIKFDPNGYLYITTGDAENPSQAQDVNTLGGKILRVTDQGNPVPGNPFDNLVFSYGHRNPQGLAWDDKGNLWATEHGRSGILSGFDELNLIEKGKNYGWPIIEGDETKTGMETPKINSGQTNTWAPAGIVFAKNSLFFGGLRGETLYEVIINQHKLTLKEHFEGEFGRVRDVTLGPDNQVYITTSNRDGRGDPTSLDDRIIRINLQKSF